MRIGEAAAAAGTTPRALRFYEQRGLLPPPARTAAGQREYAPGDVARVRLIRELLALGLTVEDLRECADRLHLLAADPAPRCAPAAPSGGIVGRRIASLDAEISRLTHLRDALAGRAPHDPRHPPPTWAAAPSPAFALRWARRAVPSPLRGGHLRWPIASRPIAAGHAVRSLSFAWGYSQRLLRDCHLRWHPGFRAGGGWARAWDP